MHIEDNSLILGQAQSLLHHTEHKEGAMSTTVLFQNIDYFYVGHIQLKNLLKETNG